MKLKKLDNQLNNLRNKEISTILELIDDKIENDMEKLIYKFDTLSNEIKSVNTRISTLENKIETHYRITDNLKDASDKQFKVIVFVVSLFGVVVSLLKLIG